MTEETQPEGILERIEDFASDVFHKVEEFIVHKAEAETVDGVTIPAGTYLATVPEVVTVTTPEPAAAPAEAPPVVGVDHAAEGGDTSLIATVATVNVPTHAAALSLPVITDDVETAITRWAEGSVKHFVNALGTEIHEVVALLEGGIAARFVRFIE